MKLFYLIIILGIVLVGIVYAQITIIKIIKIDSGISSQAEGVGIDIKNFSYTKTIDKDNSLICLYYNSHLIYPCTSIPTEEEDGWITERINENLNRKITAKLPDEEGQIIIEEAT